MPQTVYKNSTLHFANGFTITVFYKTTMMYLILLNLYEWSEIV